MLSILRGLLVAKRLVIPEGKTYQPFQTQFFASLAIVFLFAVSLTHASMVRSTANKKPDLSIGFEMFGGGRGIRTPGPLARTTVFKTAAFDHSAIPPGAKLVKFWIVEMKIEMVVWEIENLNRIHTNQKSKMNSG